MIVNSYNIEFGYELISCVPYAYWLYENGQLKQTISGTGSKPLYYFSPKHTINPRKRGWHNMTKACKANIPNIKIHKPYLDLVQIKIPPYKEYYKNDTYKFDKPIVCICNRYSVEWGKEPINFFSLECLEILFNKLKKDYQVIYFAVDLPEQLQDHYHSIELGDYKFVKKKHKDVIIFQDLLKKHSSD